MRHKERQPFEQFERRPGGGWDEPGGKSGPGGHAQRPHDHRGRGGRGGPRGRGRGRIYRGDVRTAILLVLADEPMSRQLSVKAFNHELGQTTMTFFCAPALKKTLTGRFPECLQGAPMLIQGSGSAIRRRFDLWSATHRIRPRH